jgi:hypothetical protein
MYLHEQIGGGVPVRIPHSDYVAADDAKLPVVPGVRTTLRRPGVVFLKPSFRRSRQPKDRYHRHGQRATLRHTDRLPPDNCRPKRERN